MNAKRDFHPHTPEYHSEIIKIFQNFPYNIALPKVCIRDDFSANIIIIIVWRKIESVKWFHLFHLFCIVIVYRIRLVAITHPLQLLLWWYQVCIFILQMQKDTHICHALRFAMPCQAIKKPKFQNNINAVLVTYPVAAQNKKGKTYFSVSTVLHLVLLCVPFFFGWTWNMDQRRHVEIS